MPEDFYLVLGVARDASPDDIKKAYRRLAKQFHPDQNRDDGAEDKFKEIATAYDVLSDPDKRSRYDRYGMAGIDPQAAGFSGMGGTGGFTDLSEIFEEFFSGFTGQTGRRSGRRQARPGRDLRYDMTLTFEESIFGVEKEIEVTRLETCEHCQGRGAEPGTSPRRCPDCNGTGESRRVSQTFLGSMVNVMPCQRCQGRGEIIETPCKECRGQTQVRKARKLSVKVPGGIDENSKLRYSGEGEPGENGGPRWNLFFFFRIQPHQFFKREGDDILLDFKINVAEAALGTTVRIPTVDAELDLEIPPGTQSGKHFRLSGKGAPRISDQSRTRRDQLVTVHVGVPTKLTADQRRLFEELGHTLG